MTATQMAVKAWPEHHSPNSDSAAGYSDMPCEATEHGKYNQQMQTPQREWSRSLCFRSCLQGWRLRLKSKAVKLSVAFHRPSGSRPESVALPAHIMGYREDSSEWTSL